MNFKKLATFLVLFLNISFFNNVYGEELLNNNKTVFKVQNIYEYSIESILNDYLFNEISPFTDITSDTIIDNKIVNYDVLVVKGRKLELRNDSRLTIDAAGHMDLESGSSLLLNHSTLQNSATFNNYMFMDGGSITVSILNESYVSIDEVRNWVEIREPVTGDVIKKAEANIFNLFVKDSIATFNSIYFVAQGTPSNPDGGDVVIIKSENTPENKGKYNIVISGEYQEDRYGFNRNIAIQSSSIYIEISHSDLKIRGDIVGNDRASNVQDIKLIDSNFEFTGNLIENVKMINLSENSLFTFGKDEDFKKRVIELSSYFAFDSEESDAKLGTMKLVSEIENISFKLRAGSALEAGDLIVAREDGNGNSVTSAETDKMNIYIDVLGESSFKIDNVDLRGFTGCGVDPGKTCKDKYPNGFDIFETSPENLPVVLRLQGSSDSKIQMNDVYIDNNYASIYFIYSSGFPQVEINSINYSDYDAENNAYDTTTNQMNFTGNPTDTAKIKIKNINIKTSEEMVTVNLNNTRFRVTETFNIVNTNGKNQDVLFRGYASEVFISDLKCSPSCNNFEFIPGDSVKSSINTLIFNNIYSYSDSLATNEFHLQSFRITVNNDFNYNGHLNLEKDSDLIVGNYNGVMYGADLDSSTLQINKSSSITLKGDINLQNGSNLTISASDVFEDPANNRVNINLNNNSSLLIDGKNYIDNIQALVNSEVTLKSGVSVDTLFSDDTSIVNLYYNTYIKELTNQNKLNVYGYTYVDKFVNESKEINFYIDAKYYNNTSDCGSLFCVKEVDSSNSNKDIKVSVTFLNTTMFKPGHINGFNVYHSDSGKLGIDEDYIANSLAVLPPWLHHDESIENNNTGGEDLVINVERLTDYTTLMKYLGNEDSQVSDMARVIDNIVEQDRVEAGDSMVDIVNSLDYNSGCVQGTQQEEIIYEINNGDDSRIDEVTCLVGLQNNFLSMKPIHNEVFLNYMHNSVSNNIDALLNENRNYYGLNETNFWVKDSLNGSALVSQNDVIGYHSFANDIQVGLTGSYIPNINTTIMFGISPGSMGSQSNFYDSTVNVMHLGASVTYINYYLFSTIAVMGSTSKFHNTRHVDFLVNGYSQSGGNSFSSDTVNEIALKVEIGTEWSISKVKVPEYILPDSVIDELNIVPRAFIQISDVNGNDFVESGSSASMTYEGFNTAILDLGVGIDFYEEILIDEFLYIKNGFWQPKFGVNIKERYYKTPGSSVYFNGYTNPEDVIQSTSQDNAYTGVEMDAKFSLSVTKNQYVLVAEYAFARGYGGGYINNTLQFTLRYALK